MLLYVYLDNMFILDNNEYMIKCTKKMLTNKCHSWHDIKIS